MKFTFAFPQIISHFGCRDKEEIASISPDLVGSYELSSTKPSSSYLFHDLLNFKEKIAATATAGGNTYRLQFKQMGRLEKVLPQLPLIIYSPPT